MALNPTDQDMRGRLDPNFNGRFDSRWPNGDKPDAGGGEPPMGAEQITIVSTEAGVASFGGGPNVVFFDRVDQPEGADFNLNSPHIGVYDSISLHSGSNTHNYINADGRTWIPAVDPERLSEDILALAKPRIRTPGSASIFVAYKIAAIPGTIFPTALQEGQFAFPPSGNYKPVWPSDMSNTKELADIVIGTYSINGRTIAGNTNRPRRYTPSEGWIYYNGRFPTEGSPSLISYHQSGDESADGARDARLEAITIDADGGIVSEGFGDPYVINDAGTGITKKIYDDYFLNAQLGNLSTSSVNIQSGMADIYIAEGNNCGAFIMMANAPTIAETTEAYFIPPETWTDTEISCHVVARENLPYVHISLADGTKIENAKGVA